MNINYIKKLVFSDELASSSMRALNITTYESLIRIMMDGGVCYIIMDTGFGKSNNGFAKKVGFPLGK